ncbi:hypothetical protein SAMN05421810_107242 [Amycolatopsis arida]|uniref:Uncharacterized protein n=1 Tax=Amycolatopsis arida TaxID=587909 RepID=A0A1I5YL64_9PSEU|nr:hypothetical protein [Amycolatopsis arida]TDX90595.1 hypothetical protein CLV69_107242 [Amycolatopsis arida]SFQ44936.1 hypothetical protein SAMN05421810_107242 [Amycolatopsis arida]
MSEAADGRRGPLVLAATTGFVIGSGVLGLLWALSGVSGPAADARAACAALERAGDLPEPTRGNPDPPLAPGTWRRIAAARELATAAAELDGRYQSLADHIDGVSRMVVSRHLADPGGRWHLRQARRACTQV